MATRHTQRHANELVQRHPKQQIQNLKKSMCQISEHFGTLRNTQEHVHIFLYKFLVQTVIIIKFVIYLLLSNNKVSGINQACFALLILSKCLDAIVYSHTTPAHGACNRTVMAVVAQHQKNHYFSRKQTTLFAKKFYHWSKMPSWNYLLTVVIL
jgi:hypothetical protein